MVVVSHDTNRVEYTLVVALQSSVIISRNGSSLMGLFDALRAVFGRGTPDPPDARKLAASSENELAAAIQALPVGEKGWIAFRDAWHLFSRADEPYAFGEIDDDGRRRLEAFASDLKHPSAIDFMPVEGRVYFTRG
jgi:Flp pilus assembly pilin Flp